MFRRIVPYIFLISLFLSPMTAISYAQEQQQCEGDPEMCAQIIELKQNLEIQKQLARKAQSSVRGEEEETSDSAAKMMAFAAALAIGLKLLIGVVSSWKGYFQTDKEKAWLKIGLVVGGFVVFLATNIGFGINWWQSLILAGGGPGSILVHELSKLIPVLMGKKKYSEVDPDDDPTTSLPPNS